MMTQVFAVAGLALVVARHVVPAESAHLGETLWIVECWLLLALAWSVVRVRFSSASTRLDRADLAVMLLAGGHILSAGLVLLSSGQQRAALNMLWEWAGIAVATVLLRRWLPQPRLWRTGLSVLATAGVVLAGLGIWQNAVTYPALRAQLEEFTRLESEAESRPLDTSETARFSELRAELGALATEQDPQVRFGLRQRLLASTEPLGCFALANTLAGVLAVAVVLLLGALIASIATRRSLFDKLRMVIPLIVTTYCLVLTKSRTAWLALMAGLAVWGLASAWKGKLRRPPVAAAAVGVGVLLALVVAAWQAGALDRLVLLEAPKSLQYRIEYWTATWSVIRDHVLFGVGPGNFRQHYVRYKLPGSSEDVLDPHNAVLDVWANGGLVAVAGLLWGAGLAAQQWQRVLRATPAITDAASHPPADAETRPVRKLVLLSGIAGIGLVLLQRWVIEVDLDARLAALLAGWIAAALILPPIDFGATARLAAGLVLGVHLLGAGGIAMPVITITLLLLWFGPRCEFEPAGGAGETISSPRFLRGMAVPVVFAALSVLCLVTAVIPVGLSGLHVAAAMDVMLQRGDVAVARRLLQQAREADPLDPQPLVYLAQLEHDAAQRGIDGGDGRKRALELLREASRLDPDNSKTYWLIAQWELERYRHSGSDEALAQAVQNAEEAVRRDPQHSAVLATLAQALSAVGKPDDARDAAARALSLDELNRQRGHFDRLLDDKTRMALQDITGTPSSGGGPGSSSETPGE